MDGSLCVWGAGASRVYMGRCVRVLRFVLVWLARVMCILNQSVWSQSTECIHDAREQPLAP
jgi:hypothetical protein